MLGIISQQKILDIRLGKKRYVCVCVCVFRQFLAIYVDNSLTKAPLIYACLEPSGRHDIASTVNNIIILPMKRWLNEEMD